MKRNLTVPLRCSSRISELRSHASSNLDSNEESSSSYDLSKEMETNKADGAGSSNPDVKKYKCPQCPKQYKLRGSLTTHMRIHDQNRLITCDVCDDKIFSTIHAYKYHMLTHTVEKLHECPTCNRWFGRIYTLKAHQYLHLEEKKFKCSVCPVDRYFQTPKKLSDHMLVHKGKRHKCSICHKEFYRKQELDIHVQSVHTKLKPYQCGNCMKRFHQVGHLNRHVRMHTGEKPYKCELCDKGFTDSTTHKSHQKNCARLMEKRQHLCLKCPKRYSRKISLNRHMKIHNKETTNVI